MEDGVPGNRAEAGTLELKKSISFSDFVGDALSRLSSFLLSAKFKGTDLRGRISRLAGFLRRKEVDTGGILPYAVFRKYTRQRRNCEVKSLVLD